MMVYEGQTIVTKTQFKRIMLPMAAFVACDSDGGGNLDVDELKTLFWLVEGKEPEHSRI
jgi:hypothetical protein